MAVHRSSMDRPNLLLAVVPLEGWAQKLGYLAQLVAKLPRTGLLYCAARDHTVLVADYLSSRGFEVAAYHAGLEPTVKRSLQEDFLRGRFAAIAATNALGMGIDFAYSSWGLAFVATVPLERLPSRARHHPPDGPP